MCSSDAASLVDDGSPIADSYLFGNDTSFNVIDAVPDSTGNFIYFIGRDKEFARKGVFRVKADGTAFCKLFDDPLFNADRIVMSGDNNTLYLNQIWPNDPVKVGGISAIDLGFPTSCQTTVPQGLAWSNGLTVSAMDIHLDGGGDVFHFLARDTQDPGQPPPGLRTGSRSELGPLLSNLGGESGLDLAFGTGTQFVLLKLDKLAEFGVNWATVAVNPDLGIGAAAIALSLSEDVVYASGGNRNSSYVSALNWATSTARQSDPLEHPAPPNMNCDPGACLPPSLQPFRTPSRINRAMRKDVFSWVTGNGELHVFTPK